MCARFQASPKESHLTTVKHIIRYLIGTQNMGLWHPKGTNCHLLGNALVSWHSKAEASVTLSTAEAEYMVPASCHAQIIWMKQQFSDLISRLISKLFQLSVTLLVP